MKQEFLNAYIWMFGATKKEALKAWKQASESYKQAIIEGYHGNAQKAFYND